MSGIYLLKLRTSHAENLIIKIIVNNNYNYNNNNNNNNNNSQMSNNIYINSTYKNISKRFTQFKNITNILIYRN